MLPFMRAEDWLGSYQKVEWIDVTLQRMARRLSRGEMLASGVEELRRNYERFEQDFLAFFPALIAFVSALAHAPPNESSSPGHSGVQGSE